MTTPTIKLITVQPSAFTDNLWLVDRDPNDEDYHPDTDTSTLVEGHRLPYPFHAYEDGLIHRQAFWRGKPRRIIGFSDTPNPGKVDLWWRDAVKDPQQAIGKYVITQDVGGGMATHQTAIQSVEVIEVDPSTRDADERALKGEDSDE